MVLAGVSVHEDYELFGEPREVGRRVGVLATPVGAERGKVWDRGCVAAAETECWVVGVWGPVGAGLAGVVLVVCHGVVILFVVSRGR